MKRSLKDRLIEADVKGNRYLADANEAFESGKFKKADRLYESGQRWLDRYNELAGNN